MLKYDCISRISRTRLIRLQIDLEKVDLQLYRGPTESRILT